MKENKRTIIFMTAVGFIMMIVTAVAMSFAYFTAVIEEGDIFSTTGKAVDDSYRITMTEVQSGVSLNNTYPMPDVNGLELDPYNFTVTNEDTVKLTIDVYMEVLNTSTLADELVNVGIDGKVKTLNSNTATPSESRFRSSYKIYSFDLDPNESKTYDLRTWINANGTIENAQNKTWAGRILVRPRSYIPLITLANGLKSNDPSITDYNFGNEEEMFVFTHPATAQTEALTDYRYIGANPNNYIDFNDETWRIIGVFTVETENGSKEQLIKIIHDEYIGNLPWDDYTDGSRTNEWSTSSLQSLLNGGYYNTEGSFSYTYKTSSTSTGTTISISKGLNATARNQIANVKWYLGGSSTLSGLGGPDYYAFERGTTTYQNSRTTSIVQKVGLMYPSDYIYTYANGVDNTCYTNGYNCQTSNGGTPTNGWLFKNSVYQWSLSPNAGLASYAFLVRSLGLVNRDLVSNTNAVRPTVFLASDVAITGGDGSAGNHYKLG